MAMHKPWPHCLAFHSTLPAIDQQALLLLELETVQMRAASWLHDHSVVHVAVSGTPAIVYTSSVAATSENHYHPHAVCGEIVTFPKSQQV